MAFPTGDVTTGGTAGDITWSFLLQATTNSINKTTSKYLVLHILNFIIIGSLKSPIAVLKKHTHTSLN